MKNAKIAIINSLGVFIYVSIVATVMSNANKLFRGPDNAVTAIGVLMLSTLSAAVVGSLVVGKPILLYLDGKKKEAVNLLLTTLACLAILTILVLGYLALR